MVSLEVSLNTGHEDIVHDAQMDFYGRFLATCSADSSVKIFEVTNDGHKEIKEFREHQGPVWQVQWCHPQYGKVLASCGYDKKIIFYGEINGQWQKIRECINHDSSVNSIAWAPPEYGAVLASGSSDGSIGITTIQADELFDTQKIPEAHKIGVNSVCWAPILLSENATDQQKIVKRLVSGGSDNDVKIFIEGSDSGTWRVDKTLRGHNDWVLEVAWRPATISKDDMIASCDRLGSVILWTRPQHYSGQTSTGCRPEWQRTDLCQFPQIPVWHLSWSITGDILAVSCGENNISLWRQNLEGHWTRFSGVNQGEGDVNVSED